MIGFVLRKIFGTKNDRVLRQIWPMVEIINSHESALSKLSDDELKAKTPHFKQRLENGETLDELLPEAFAVAREASKRALGMRPFDVQLIGGIVLHQGKIAEMKTGEGKTLVATMPVYLNALSGKGVHVVTVNDYLARRDAEWMGEIYHFLGLSTGVVVNQLSHEERLAAYGADITYGQNNEFGFDYLRDNMKIELSEMVQRAHNYAIVDEVDSILIDEARTPLIISGPAERSTDSYLVADRVARRMKEGEHFTVDLKSKQVMLEDDGVRLVEELLKLDNLYDPGNIEVVHHINQALKAHVTMKRDVDYLIRNGQVMIVDEFTGRVLPGRRWSDGLHQAVEAKEGVEIQRENQTLATVTFQNYFRMYKKLAGMTGTADTEAIEFRKIYNLDVVVAPTNMPMLRTDYSDVIFANERAKYKAVCDEIENLHEAGQPVLVGTASIARSEQISEMLERRGIPHHVLNAKHHEREAEFVAQAGRYQAVTISTNMAGRGTDIILGGNPVFLAAAAAGTRDTDDPEYQAQLVQFKQVCQEEREKVVKAGGLHILGTERHESRRIDNQLRGRSGRQGDPGSSRFFVSLEDDLMKRFGGERMQAIMSRVGMRDEDAIEGTLVAKAIENAQRKVEGHHFDIRKHLLEYDDVMNKHREVVYSLREKMLRSDGIEDEILQMMGDVIEEIVGEKASEKEPPANWNVAAMFDDFGRVFGLKLPPDTFLERRASATKKFAQEIFDHMREMAVVRYEERKLHFGAERMIKLERIVFLQAVDYFWKEHLNNMDHLKEGIGLRGYAQQNPLHIYQQEAYGMFASMMGSVREAVMQNIFIPELPSDEELREIEEREREAQHRREEAARTIHEDVVDNIGSNSQPSPDGMNRAQRRFQQKVTQKTKYTPKAEDYAPMPVQGSTASRAKKTAARKKNKEARKARKKAR